MTMFYVKTHGFSFDSELFLVFGATGGAESGMTVMINNIEVTTGRAFKIVITKIFSFTEESALNIIKNSITQHSTVI